jgi:hypothetical protein
MAFHSHDGWFWERGPDGSVRVFVQKPGEGILAEHVVDAATWASITAAVGFGDWLGAYKSHTASTTTEGPPFTYTLHYAYPKKTCSCQPPLSGCSDPGCR